MYSLISSDVFILVCHYHIESVHAHDAQESPLCDPRLLSLPTSFPRQHQICFLSLYIVCIPQNFIEMESQYGLLFFFFFWQSGGEGCALSTQHNFSLRLIHTVSRVSS